MTGNNSDKKAINLLDDLISIYRKEGYQGVLPDCSVFGNPALNYLYCEVYSCSKNKSPILSLAGSGIFLEEITNELWVSTLVHKAQLMAKFKTWDDIMVFHEAAFNDIESKKIEYKKDMKPVLEKVLEPSDLESMELIRNFVRNTFIHSKRAKFIKALQDEGILEKRVTVGKATIVEGEVSKVEQIPMSLTHSLLRSIGFNVLAEQLAPALIIFIFYIFKKYHKDIAPLEDKIMGFSRHRCKYD